MCSDKPSPRISMSIHFGGKSCSRGPGRTHDASLHTRTRLSLSQVSHALICSRVLVINDSPHWAQKYPKPALKAFVGRSAPGWPSISRASALQPARRSTPEHLLSQYASPRTSAACIGRQRTSAACRRQQHGRAVLVDSVSPVVKSAYGFSA